MVSELECKVGVQQRRTIDLLFVLHALRSGCVNETIVLVGIATVGPHPVGKRQERHSPHVPRNTSVNVPRPLSQGQRARTETNL